MPQKPHSRRYSFVQLDVFTSKPLEGNPLAVFTDARGLSDAEMQALAREMNLSETTFILPRDPEVERERGVLVRIFTPEEELPFAGHPTLGTAMVLRGPGLNPQEVVLDLAVGKVPVTFRQDSEGEVFGEMRQRDPEFGSAHSREVVARVIGLPVENIASDLPIETVSTGVAYAIVPIKSLESLRALRPNWHALSDYLRESDAKDFYFVTPDPEHPAARFEARGIFSTGEDPATGSAAGCAVAWMVRHGVARPGESLLIEQGIEVKRPSRIFVRASLEGQRVVNVRVGGHAVEIIRGEVFFY